MVAVKNPAPKVDKAPPFKFVALGEASVLDGLLLMLEAGLVAEVLVVREEVTDVVEEVVPEVKEVVPVRLVDEVVPVPVEVEEEVEELDTAAMLNSPVEA
jgi:hypothetical protein